MINLFSKNNFVRLSVIALGLSIFVGTTAKASTEIDGRYLTADLSAADLLGVAKENPVFFSVAFIALIVFIVGYVLYYFLKKKAVKQP